ncbi:MAG TPA: RNA 2',3'-cyclic phosphodiesterase [Persephonella sp.]|nr:RNA 2',3'-cyclic phosphodiesterase [Hydrogenothermaceae bacterium]HIQ24918.1 RNA 2',3'-cyclic phosphodiesterase [Persephonella sp.]
MRKKRLFIGSFINTDTLKNEYSKVRKELGNSIKGKWTPFENLHITYKFLGNIEVDRISSIKNAINKYLNKNIECNFEVKGIGAFPSIYTPKVVFLRVNDKSGVLEDIYYYIQSRLKNLGFEEDKKKFIPHITIKRPKEVNVKKFYKKVKLFEDKIFVQISKIEINLIESILSPNGARYKKI